MLICSMLLRPRSLLATLYLSNPLSDVVTNILLSSFTHSPAVLQDQSCLLRLLLLIHLSLPQECFTTLPVSPSLSWGFRSVGHRA